MRLLRVRISLNPVNARASQVFSDDDKLARSERTNDTLQL
jgi:hypothetical protein